jgi:hypothetical protein
MRRPRRPSRRLGLRRCDLAVAEELADELHAAGLPSIEVHGVEGLAGLALDATRSHDHDHGLLDASRRLAAAFGHQPGLRDLSPRLLGIAQVPAP